MRARLLFVIRLSISLTLLGYLFWLVDFETVRSNLVAIDAIYVAFAVALLLCQSLLSTLKWRTLLSADDVRLNYFFLLRTYLISNFFSLFLPTSFGGDVYRVIAVRKAANSTAKTASSVIFDRLTGLFALVSIACVAYLFYPGLPLKWLVVTAYSSVLLFFWLGVSGRVVKWFSAVQGGHAKKLLSILVSFHTYARQRHCLISVIAISFVFQLNIVLINKMYSLAFGLDVPITTLLIIIPLVYLTEAIPLSINGLGFREGAFVFFYQLVGQPAGSGFAVSLLVLTMRYTIGLIGGLLYFSKVIGEKFREPDT